MKLYEVQETIRKHITVIKKTIIKPLGIDIIFKIPKDKVKNGEKRHNEREKVRTEDIGDGSA